MELTDKSAVWIPKMVTWEKEGVHLFLDPESPHWIATDARAAQIVRWMEERLSFGQVIRRYAEQYGVDSSKAWLHVHDFARSLLRVEFASLEPVSLPAYAGRGAYAQPVGLKELWFHTNNICNLACAHCLVNSAPWVKDWGLSTEALLRLVDEAVLLGVGRFYFTGGEPFMRRDLIRLIRTITESKGCELILLTNATLFKGERAQEIRSLDRSRLRFQVSLDGASAFANDPIRGKGSFQAAVEGLRLLVSLGFQTSVTTVATASNMAELVGITRLAHTLGVPFQHLMWPHHRGRIVGHKEGTAPLGFPNPDRLIETIRQVKRVADELGVRVDNMESIKQRVNGRSRVKYDLGNACWDSLCVWSDGTVYPSAALANVRPLALGSLGEGKGLREIWENSRVAQLFRQASVVSMDHLKDEPFRYLTGGGDLEHSFLFGLNGESERAEVPLERIAQLLTGGDPYYPLYTAMIQDAMWELAFQKQAALNRRSGYDAPRILHAMGEGAIHCATDDLAVTGQMDVRTLHSNCVLAFDVDKPRKMVREFYAEAAETPQRELCCPTKFDDSAIAHIPKEVIDRFYGCGSPVALGRLKPGETFVDLGSGAGIDCFIAAKQVGSAGKVIGIDMTDPMLEVANQNCPIVAAQLGYDVVEFRKGYLEAVPVESKSVDLITSNCVINLSPDKPKVFSEIWRMLKDHGRTVISDIVSIRPVPAHLKVNPKLWGECTVGALTEEEFLAQLQEAGFHGLTALKKTYWKTIDGYDFYSVTVQGFKFEKGSDCRFIGQKAVYLGPMKSVIDDEGHLFPRGVSVEVCTDTAAKLSKPPYTGSFLVTTKQSLEIASPLSAPRNDDCGPGCC